VRRVCVTNIVTHPHAPGPNDGSWNSTPLLMAVLVAALAAAVVTLGAMFGWRVDA
jgi:hypothetical protein